MEPSRMRPTEALAELGRIRLADVELDKVLHRVAELANQSIPGCSYVSVTLTQAGTARTVVATADLARELDEWQYRYDQGPCLDAAVSAESLLVPDMAGEQRWADWVARAGAAGVGSSLSIGLPIQEAVTGALNLYGVAAHAFDAESIAVAEDFAAYAAVALANAHLYDSTATLARQMRDAMRSRAVIEQAKGIIMGERRCSPVEAFAVLAKISQDSNRRVRDVAEALVAAIGTDR